ncbi:DUF1638 domain-containing protein [Dehalobacterium formicoaceticum]|uniref:DUF1638 domain-containing protein n=1 Tax=Dehalobacterium formicoaceticum TaxID=51515 RepID=A0ABT1Y082_9FIRM|nr:DUF1638 domain-containing protein [Dehalobacterium formicoaceticum]MCR6544263.1 DUF1638 domain-containing protein [Dehalobacterium formicoaceticum]
MKAVICACRTIEDELNFVLQENKIDFPVIYMEAGLHDDPEKLKSVLQNTIDRIENIDYILLGYALCGNGLIGLSSKKAALVLPQYHDCVAMFLGSDERYRANLGTEMAALFITGGSMRHFNPKYTFYEKMIPRLGEKKALRYSQLVFQNYKRFALVETGAFSAEPLFQEMKDQAEFFNLETHRMKGTVDIFRKLVLGQWDEHFQIVPPGQKIQIWNLSSNIDNKIMPGL